MKVGRPENSSSKVARTTEWFDCVIYKRCFASTIIDKTDLKPFEVVGMLMMLRFERSIPAPFWENSLFDFTSYRGVGARLNVVH